MSLSHLLRTITLSKPTCEIETFESVACHVRYLTEHLMAVTI